MKPMSPEAKAAFDALPPDAQAAFREIDAMAEKGGQDAIYLRAHLPILLAFLSKKASTAICHDVVRSALQLYRKESILEFLNALLDGVISDDATQINIKKLMLRIHQTFETFEADNRTHSLQLVNLCSALKDTA